MAEIINLRLARKARARATREAEAAANRAAHGRPKAERDRQKAEINLATARLEGHRREPDDEPG